MNARLVKAVRYLAPFWWCQRRGPTLQLFAEMSGESRWIEQRSEKEIELNKAR